MPTPQSRSVCDETRWTCWLIPEFQLGHGLETVIGIPIPTHVSVSCCDTTLAAASDPPGVSSHMLLPLREESLSSVLAALLLAIFFSSVTFVVLIQSHARMFFPRYARRHRLLGLADMLLLMIASLDAFCGEEFESNWQLVALHVSIGVVGTATSLSAAYDHPAHRRAQNVASGTLDDKATVTYSEMVEHTFYQLLNLEQVLFLYAVPALARLFGRWSGTGGFGAGGKVHLLLSFGATIGVSTFSAWPWTTRAWFPVNRFSDNYKKPGTQPFSLIGILYRIKKYQYLLYKHTLLHGLNASVVIHSFVVVSEPSDIWLRPLPETRLFRQYWACLNTSYVMEFFLQTLVKRRYLSQEAMLRLQLVLMAAASITALRLVCHCVDPAVAAVSLVLNIVNRGHEVANLAIATTVGLLATQMRNSL